MEPHRRAAHVQADQFGQPFAEASPTGRVVDRDAGPGERAYAMWTHLGPMIAWFVAAGSSGIGFPIPLAVAWIMWLSRKNDSPFLDDHGKQSLNFQISLIAIFLILILLAIPTCFVTFAASPLIIVLAIVGAIMGSVAANRGEFFRYPMTWTWVK
ncbi:MAG: DUF4870 domain-containing protein [Phycisphaerales bacterium]|nr:MAG: DUF4870 domain-containing protein [Phycisphaerales bacterium]